MALSHTDHQLSKDTQREALAEGLVWSLQTYVRPVGMPSSEC